MAKTDFDNSASSLDSKSGASKTKNESIENESKKTFDSSYFRGRGHFEEDGTQNYLVFQPINTYFKVIASADYASS